MTPTRPHTTGSPGYSETWRSEAETARRARGLVRAALNTWNLNGDLLDRAQLVVSELVTNSITHSGCKLLRVSVTRYSHYGVRITVTDKSKKQPEPRRPALDDTSGRGLLLVQTMADDWGVTERSFGKSVYADLLVEDPD
ncbi:ATP-binding protein [Streptomyces cuspidosporus]|uniref:ATP-binding protein n=1 Tax=Streptomyces cuspidosporus TaxID=66882 RepID=UPI0031FBC79D